MFRQDESFAQDTQVEFRSMWRKHFQIECANETLRQRLLARPFFNLADAFDSLDLNEDGRLTLTELERLIESKGYTVSQ